MRGPNLAKCGLRYGIPAGGKNQEGLTKGRMTRLDLIVPTTRSRVDEEAIE